MEKGSREKLELENFCVYCESRKSYSYFQKCLNVHKNLETFNNKYEKVVQEKIIKYNWIQNLSNEECFQLVLSNISEKMRRKMQRKKKSRNNNNNFEHVEEKSYEGNNEHCSSTSACKQNNESFYQYNRHFFKNARKMEITDIHIFKPKAYAQMEILKKKKKKKEIYKDRNNLNGEQVQDRLANVKLINVQKWKKKKKRGNIHKYLFNPFARRKYYKRVSHVWLRNFLKKNGPLYKKLAKQLINFLVIKNFLIFDVELWNFFFSKNFINHFNINLHFIVGKPGNEKTQFLKNILDSFPFKYTNDITYFIDISQYEKCPIVSDYRYALYPNTFLHKEKHGIKNSSTSNSPPAHDHSEKERRKKNKSNLSVKIYDHLKVKEKHMHVARLGNHCESGDSISTSDGSCSSFDLHTLRDNEYINRSCFLRRDKEEAYRRREYVNKILYPTYYDIALKDLALVDVERREIIRSIDPFNENLENVLASFTKIAMVKQLVWRKTVCRILEKVLSKKGKRKVPKKGAREDEKEGALKTALKSRGGNKMKGMNLFCGGFSFLVIKNFECMQNFPVLKKNCIMFLLLKFIFIWKNLNLNAHAFVLTSGGTESALVDSSIFPISSAGSIHLTAYVENIFRFVLPQFLHKEDRQKLLIHLFRKNNLNFSIRQIDDVAKMTKSFTTSSLIKLFQDEYRERIVYFLKKKNIANQLENVECIQNFLRHEKKKKRHFFSKTLSFEKDLRLYLHGQEIEIYKKKGVKQFRKKGKDHDATPFEDREGCGFSDIVGEDILLYKIKREVLRYFLSLNEEKDTECLEDPFDAVGILIHGNSGSGKTFICQKIIEECNCNSIIINCANIFNKIMGESEKILNEIFEYAKRKLQPCILIFDDIENVCIREDIILTSMNRFTKRLKLCFYENIDKLHFEKKWYSSNMNIRSSILVIGTTSDIKNIDQNLLTSHRIRYIYKTREFKFWNESDVYTLFEKCLLQRNIKPYNFMHTEMFRTFMKMHIFTKQEKLSPLFISNLCADALTRCVRRAISKGNDVQNEIEVEDFYASVQAPHW
ncbi:AAA family ATPase, putative [Plasmodium ovale]|uniref:AAA family ATPase, putative n=1 Tax=Plasmodium ovale TaxID=36330 RepID=A0A1C3KMG6_PLAOA|nr:AAA family ATPase, putative [Plasmodium ovale]